VAIEKEEMFSEELRLMNGILESAKSADSFLTESTRAHVRNVVIKTMNATKNYEEGGSIIAALFVRYIMKRPNQQIISNSARTVTAISSRTNDLLDLVARSKWRDFQAIIKAAKSDSLSYIPTTYRGGGKLTLRESRSESVE